MSYEVIKRRLWRDDKILILYIALVGNLLAQMAGEGTILLYIIGGLLYVGIINYDNNEYNWGYNPLAYNCLEPDYVYDKENYYAYINEFRHMVNTLHKHNIKVVLDVVFNHVYDIKNNDLQKMVPDLFFRKRADGTGNARARGA